MLTPEQYEKKKALLASGGSFSPEAVAKVQAALDEYEGAQGKEPDLGGSLVNLLDPMSPLVPQGLSVTPSTTHPVSDEEAQADWVRGDLKNPNGVVIVYDAPMRVVREDLAKNPALLDYVGHSISPGAAVEKGSATEQAYQTHKWRETADAATKAGKTAYRYNLSPWLGDGKSASLLDSLSTKVKASVLPGVEGATAFVMGVDNTGNFGAANAASDAGLLGSDAPPKLTPEEEASGKYDYHPTLGKVPKGWVKKGSAGGTPIGGGGDEVVGGVSASSAGISARDSNDMLREENPKTRLAGEVFGAVPGAVTGAAGWAAKGAAKGAVALGEAATKAGAKELGPALVGAAQRGGGAVQGGLETLKSWNPANGLWDFIMGQAPQSAGGIAMGVARAGAAGAATQGIREGVQAGANYAETGETGTTARETVDRIGDAALGAAATHGAITAVSQGGGRWVRQGARYQGLPGEVEALNGGKVYPVVGHATPPALREARAEGLRREVPVDAVGVLAEQTKKPLFDAAKGHTTDIKRAVGQRNSAFEVTAEGQEKLPYRNLAGKALDKTRERLSSSGRGPLRSVGVPNAERNPRGIFNTNIEGVSLTPREGWIPISTREVDDVLSPANRARTLRASRSPGKAAMRSEGALDRTAPGGAATHRRPPPPTGIQRSGDDTGPIDRRGYQASRPKQLPSGEATGLSTARPGQQSYRRLDESGTRFHGGEQRALARLDPAGQVTRRPASPGGPVAETRARPAGPKDGIPDAEFTEKGPAPIPDAEFTERPQRAQAKPARPQKQPLPRGVKPGTLGQELRKRGIKTVYVAPRRYNAQHGESATRQLRRKGADSPNDRDMVDLHHASLVDRDQRKLGGAPGGWSKQQQENEAAIRAAKDTQRRAAGEKRSDTSGKVLSFANRKPGDSEDVAAMMETANRAGGRTPERVKAARAENPLARLQSIGGFGREGGRWLLGANNLFDAGVLRGVYPVTRALEKTSAGKLSRAGGNREAEEKRQKARDEANKAETKKNLKDNDGDKAARRKARRVIVRKKKP